MADNLEDTQPDISPEEEPEEEVEGKKYDGGPIPQAEED